MNKLNSLLLLGCDAISFSAGASSLGQDTDASVANTFTSSTSFLDNKLLENSSEKVLKS